MKWIWAVASMQFLLTGCFVTPKQTQISQHAKQQTQSEIIWIEQVPTYSDFATFSVENLPYQDEGDMNRYKSDFGINLIFDEPAGRQVHTVYFDTASSHIRPSEKLKLQALSDSLTLRQVYLSGYADPRGGVYYNQKLSESRVREVEKFLKRKGFTVNRTCAYGKTKEPDFNLCQEGEGSYE